MVVKNKKQIKNVSVVMCTYNGQEYLKEQINSILNQTYPIYEIIVHDDCSVDNTWSILQEYSDKFDKFKCYKNSQNIGYPLNFKAAVLHSSGEYIAISDQDDIWMLNKIEVLIRLISNNLVVVSQSNVLNNDEIKYGSVINPFFTHVDLNINFEKLIWGNSLLGHSCLIHGSLRNYFNEIKVEVAHDLLIAFIGYYNNSVVITDQILQIWRRYDNAATCNLQKVINDKKKNKSKILYCIYSLLTNKKSLIIEQVFRDYNYIFSYLYKAGDLKQRNIKELIKLTNLLSDQSFLGYIKSSFICLKLRKEMFDCNKLTLKKIYSITTFIYVWWYDYRFNRW